MQIEQAREVAKIVRKKEEWNEFKDFMKRSEFGFMTNYCFPLKVNSPDDKRLKLILEESIDAIIDELCKEIEAIKPE